MTALAEGQRLGEKQAEGRRAGAGRRGETGCPPWNLHQLNKWLSRILHFGSYSRCRASRGTPEKEERAVKVLPTARRANSVSQRKQH